MADEEPKVEVLGHFQVKCSCGEVITQCECSKNPTVLYKVYIVDHSCVSCGARRSHAELLLKQHQRRNPERDRPEVHTPYSTSQYSQARIKRTEPPYVGGVHMTSPPPVPTTISPEAMLEKVTPALQSLTDLSLELRRIVRETGKQER